MVADHFDSLLQELGKSMQIEDLHLDSSGTCLIAFPSGLEVYIEPYRQGNFMLISTNVGEVPPGRYREDVFKEALKANGISHPRHGTFAFSDQTGQLILFALLSLNELNGEKIATFLTPYMEKAVSWKNMISSGNIPVAQTAYTSKTSAPMGMFGMRP